MRKNIEVQRWWRLFVSHVAATMRKHGIGELRVKISGKKVVFELTPEE